MSKQRSLRKTNLRLVEDEEDDGGGVAMPPAAVKASQLKTKDKRSAGRKAPFLSFEEDTAGDTSPPSPSSKGTKPRVGLRVAPPSHAPPVSTATYAQRSGTGQYTADRLKELQQSTRRLPPSAAAPPESTGVRLSGTFISQASTKDDRFQHSIDAAGTLAAAAMPLPPPPSRTAKPHLSSAAADALTVTPDAGDEDNSSGGDIPDEETIRRAKEMRDRLRGTPGGIALVSPDYIGLGSYGVSGMESLRLHGNHRHIRGNGNEMELFEGIEGTRSDEDGKDGPIMADDVTRERFLGGLGGASSDIPGDVMLEDVEDEEDEGTATWAADQIQKGMSSGLLKARHGGQLPARAKPGFDSDGGACGVSSHVRAIAADAEAVLLSLQSSVQRSLLSQKQAKKNLASTERSLEDCTADISRTEELIKNSSEKYIFMQQLRAYLADLCAMLAEKSPLIEELQEEVQRLREGRALAHRQRREMEEIEDEEPAAAAVSAAVAALSRGGTQKDAEVAATTAATASDEILALGSHIPREIDEFGRDANAQRRAEASARVMARKARISAREARFNRLPMPQTNGDSSSTTGFEWEEQGECCIGDVTSSESEGEASRYAVRAAEIDDAAAAVFRDAADEFGSLHAVKGTLEEWKLRFPSQYHDAYVSLSAPALFAPFVRLELLSWAPLGSSSSSFDQHEWYRLLFDYGMHPENGSHAVGGKGLAGENPDADLVPRLVRSLVLPMAERLLESVWDPRSARQSKAAANLLEDLLIYVPADNTVLLRVMKLVESRLEDIVAVTKVPSWPPAALAASRRATAFLAWQFNRAIRLLKSICSFSDVLPVSFVRCLALEQLAVRHLLPHVRSAAADPGLVASRAARVLDPLPQGWFIGGPPQGMESLVELLNSIVRALERNAGHADKHVEAAPAVRKLAGVLIRLGQKEDARRISLIYGVSSD